MTEDAPYNTTLRALVVESATWVATHREATLTPVALAAIIILSGHISLVAANYWSESAQHALAGVACCFLIGFGASATLKCGQRFPTAISRLVSLLMSLKQRPTAFLIGLIVASLATLFMAHWVLPISIGIFLFGLVISRCAGPREVIETDQEFRLRLSLGAMVGVTSSLAMVGRYGAETLQALSLIAAILAVLVLLAVYRRNPVDRENYPTLIALLIAVGLVVCANHLQTYLFYNNSFAWIGVDLIAGIVGTLGGTAVAAVSISPQNHQKEIRQDATNKADHSGPVIDALAQTVQSGPQEPGNMPDSTIAHQSALKPAESIAQNQPNAAPQPGLLPSDEPSVAEPVSYALELDSIFAGRYRIISKLGEGGMSAVYKANDHNLERIVAVKVLKDHNHTLQERMRLEGRAIAKLVHDNIMSVHDLNFMPDGRPYLVLEFVDGTTLAREIKAGPLSCKRTIGIAMQICDALEEAGKHGIAHRDIKPSNVMLSNKDWVKVVDFGLAKLITADPAQGHALTGSGEVFGSPFYMSPEQCMGETIDQRTDIYSLGCVIFECLTGRPPFTGELAVHLMAGHLHKKPPNLQEMCAEQIPANVNQLVQKCLAKSPADRYQDASELRDALGELASACYLL